MPETLVSSLLAREDFADYFQPITRKMRERSRQVNLDREFGKIHEAEWASCEARGDFFTRWFGLPISLRITRLFLRLGLNENHASFTMLVTGIIGAAFLIFPPWGVFFGAVMLLVHHIFDYVDGQLARYHGRSSVHGALLDRWNHFMVETVTFPCLALGLYLQTDSIWPWLVVWVLYIWNRFRIMLSQLVANILSDELNQYPAQEREMMRRNLKEHLARRGAEPSFETSSAKPENPGKPAHSRAWVSKMRTASTSFNGFTLLLAIIAAIDLLALAWGIPGVLETGIWILGVYAVVNIIDYSWTYLRSDRIERDLAARL